MIVLPLVAKPVLAVFRGRAFSMMPSKHVTVIPFMVLTLVLLIVFSAIISALQLGYQLMFIGVLAWAVLLSLGLAMVWNAQHRIFITATIVAILGLTMSHAQSAQIRAEAFRDETSLGEWVNQERISHNPLERILEGLRLEVADYYCRTEPRIKCP